MKKNASRKLICGLIVSFSALVAVFLPTTSFSGESQDLIFLRNTILQPGDVINFSGGLGAFLGVGEFGHTGMYLGKNPDTGEKVFLDFTTNKEGRKQTEFHGRISNVEEFLNDNIEHKEFYVYHFNGAHKLPNFQKLLFDSAAAIARDKTFGNFIDCANAASRALSDATGSSIIIFNPNKFPDDFRFDPVSLPVNIKDALAEKISQNEHDRRLMSTLNAMAQYVCMGQASVTQEELDNLPRPYQEDVVLGNHSYGVGGDCYLPLYQYLAKGGADAETVKWMSMPQPVVARPIPQPVVARPIPQPAVPHPSTPFGARFSRLKRFSITACGSSEQVALEKNLYQSDLPTSFSKESDDTVENSLSTGMGVCEKQLFHKLIEMIRAGKGEQIDSNWVSKMVAGYRPTQNFGPGDNGNIPPQNDGVDDDPSPSCHQEERTHTEYRNVLVPNGFDAKGTPLYRNEYHPFPVSEIVEVCP